MTLPAESELHEIVRRTAMLQQRFGKEIGKRPMVLPNGKFFPDRFTPDEAAVQTLLGRMQGHAGLKDIPIEAKLLGGARVPAASCGCGGGAPPTEDTATKQACSCGGSCGGKGCDDCDGDCGHGKKKGGEQAPSAADPSCGKSCSTGCGSGAALPQNPLGDEPRLVDLGQSWRVQVPAAELTHAVALTTNLARTLGVVFLAETSSPANPPPTPLEVSAELVGCLLGFGSLLLAGSYVYSKSCGGPRVGRVTALGPFELAMATVLFARLHGHELRPLLRELEATQKDAVRQVSDWLDERPAIVERFMESPERLAAGDIPMQRAKAGLWSRLFGKKGTSSTPEGGLAELETLLAQAPRAAQQREARRPDPKTDELRALVDEALANGGSESQ